MARPRAFWRRKEGFTLLELMIVIVILGILGAIVAPRFMDVTHKARVVQAKMQMGNLSMAVKKFYFTFDDLAPPTAIKVSRGQLKTKVSTGVVKLTPLAQLQIVQNEGEDTPLLRRIKELIAQHLQLDVAKIGTNDHIFYDLGATSLQYFSIISDVCTEFSVSQQGNGYTAKEICAFIERNI